jgi:hypothetical protein
VVREEEMCLGCGEWNIPGLLEYIPRRSSTRGRFVCPHVPGVREAPDVNPGANPVAIHAPASDDESYGSVSPSRRTGTSSFWLAGEWYKKMRAAVINGFNSSPEASRRPVCTLVYGWCMPFVWSCEFSVFVLGSSL